MKADRRIDRYDLLAMAGLMCVVAGVWMWSPAAALIVGGMMMTGGAIFLASRR